MPQKKTKNTRYLILGAVVLVILMVAMTATSSPPSFLYALVRACAMGGYLLVFCAILSNAYIVPLVRFFGRSFVQVHHIVSVSGLVLITIHPLALALDSGTLAVFLPSGSSLIEFLQFAGRPAFYLLHIAALAAGLGLRQVIKKNWRVIHWLTYLAFLLASAHAVLIGANFQALPLRIVVIAMAAVVVYVFVTKRTNKPKRAAGR